MSIYYSVEVGDPIQNVVIENTNTYFNSIYDALTDGLHKVERLEEIHGKEITFSEKEPITKGTKEHSLHIWRGYLDGVTEPFYVQLNIEQEDNGKIIANPNIPTTKLNNDQMTFISELEGLLNRANEDGGLF
ncbi:hypothetical protein [uncultured Metabacillus sp.]|uniref:hypothetical protein n=1 Tax=uncultured Metabacillus sp. TaxID=2860135 RepID=UPI002624E52E|nr:hypothetical protein [uncultured Metabacillus sp.]